MDSSHLHGRGRLNITDESARDVDEDDSRHTSYTGVMLQLATGAVCGGCFGYAAEKGKVFEPAAVTAQLFLERVLLLKMLLAATATSMFCLSLLAMIPATSEHFQRSRHHFQLHFLDKGMVTSIIGGGILGAGMTVSGAAPAMVAVQLGAGVTSAGFTLAGCLVGVVLYGILEPFLNNMLKPRQVYMQYFLQDTQGAPYFTLSLPLAAMVSMMAFALELLDPWDREVDPKTGSVSVELMWSPHLCGVVIGLLQVPLVVILQDTLGGSTSFCTVMSQVLMSRWMRKKLPYLARFRSGVPHWWQVLFMLSAVIGAYTSASASQDVPTGVSKLSGFIGGLLIIFGARLASGCSSDHIISGIGFLSLHSLVCVPAIIVGGVSTGLMLS
ncbi:thiosulfate transporter TsuA-like [Haliotis asinina]|uniref:thiosulfate transporter TsuA-like n=1 Tax=Haliotis asinina TaxID=109174 RepID=UPI003531A795